MPAYQPAGAVLDRVAAGEPVRPEFAEGHLVAGDVVVGDQMSWRVAPIAFFFSIGRTSFGAATNSEAVAEAIVSTLVGSIGLILAVPATTALAALLALHLPERRLRREHVNVH